MLVAFRSAAEAVQLSMGVPISLDQLEDVTLKEGKGGEPLLTLRMPEGQLQLTADKKCLEQAVTLFMYLDRIRRGHLYWHGEPEAASEEAPEASLQSKGLCIRLKPACGPRSACRHLFRRRSSHLFSASNERDAHWEGAL